MVRAARPAAVVPILLPRKYRGHMTVAVEGVGSTALLSILTIPLWIQLGMEFLLK